MNLALPLPLIICMLLSRGAILEWLQQPRAQGAEGLRLDPLLCCSELRGQPFNLLAFLSLGKPAENDQVLLDQFNFARFSNLHEKLIYDVVKINRH